MEKKKPIIALVICAALAVTLIIVFLPKGADTPPSIGEPVYSQVYATENIQVTVDVTDDKGVSNVNLTYSNDSQATWYDVAMSNSGGSTWNGYIPPQDIETTIQFRINARDTANQLATNDNNSNYFEVFTGSRKAFIVCSANDFYGSEEDDTFNNGYDSNFSQDTGRWYQRVDPGGVTYNIDAGYSGALTNPGAVWIDRPDTELYSEYVYNWTDYYSLAEYGYYNLSMWLMTEGAPIIGEGVKIGLEWWNSSNQVVRTDWSSPIDVAGPYTPLIVEGVCNNATDNEITQLKLVIAMNGSFPSAVTDTISYDDVSLIWVRVNLTDPTDPDPPPPQRNKNCDGFPASALQVYKILKSQGYTDENIYFMLYYKDDADGVIDIVQGDGIANDLVGAILDVENDSVTASRVKQELNVSVTGSFASQIQSNDQLIIFMSDHGSNVKLGDKNATFHFEADKSFISEFEFYDLVSKIDCWRMMINIDCCFSGNFLNQNSSIGASWYNLSNCIFISAAANVLAWYWVDCINGDMFAGSWFFHVFWDQLSLNQTISSAFNFAINTVPAGKGQPLALIQAPLLQDNLGIKDTWSFISFSKL